MYPMPQARDALKLILAFGAVSVRGHDDDEVVS